MKHLFVLTLVSLFAVHSSSHAEDAPRYDLVVYGATPGGIAATVTAARRGRTVLLIEPTARVGGLITNGLTHPDFRSFEAHSGFYSEFNALVLDHYRRTYGDDSPQVRDSFRGTHSEPKVALQVFQEMLEEREQISVQANAYLHSVERDGTRIKSVLLRIDSEHPSQNIEVRAFGSVFIDATYEGDLMAMAKVPYRIGREARAEYDESLAPETADEQVQGYNFRLTMTNDAAIRVPIPQLEGYQREEYLPLLELIRAGEITKAVHITESGSNRQAIYKAHGVVLPNHKYDINDMSRGTVRLSLPQINNAWPDGDEATRAGLFREHLLHNVGMLYFLQNDPEVPAAIRDNANEWGLCRDEFVENQHLPYQVYVREARRMVGRKVFTQQNVSQAEEYDPRSVLAIDAIAMGDYGPNCHGTDHEGSRFGGKHTGEFYHRSAPYQIPYGVILPKTVDNLLVPVACSSSHVGFCALRLEPIWMSLGQAAGEAAHLAIEGKQSVQDVPVTNIQRNLWQTGSKTIYFSDIEFNRSPGAENTDFLATQWWGTLGGFHGLTDPSVKYGERGPHLLGQYYHAFPHHEAGLDVVLDEVIQNRWLKLAREQGLVSPKLGESKTRGEFVRIAWKLRQDK